MKFIATTLASYVSADFITEVNKLTVAGCPARQQDWGVEKSTVESTTITQAGGLGKWINATMSAHIAENTPDFHETFSHTYLVQPDKSNPETDYGHGWVTFTVSSGGHATAHGLVDTGSDDPFVVYGFNGSRGKQSENREILGLPLSVVFAAQHDWEIYESTGPRFVAEGHTTHLDESRSMLPWETQSEFVIRTKNCMNVHDYRAMIKSLLIRAAFDGGYMGSPLGWDKGSYTWGTGMGLTISENLIVEDYVKSCTLDQGDNVKAFLQACELANRQLTGF